MPPRGGYIHAMIAEAPPGGFSATRNRGANAAETPGRGPETERQGKDQMTQFSDREKAFETKFQKDQEVRFKVTARRNKLLGLWAAEKLGLQGGAADSYAKEVVAADFDEPGDNDVLRKVHKDLSGKGIEITEHGVRHEMDRLLEEAKQQIASER